MRDLWGVHSSCTSRVKKPRTSFLGQLQRFLSLKKKKKFYVSFSAVLAYVVHMEGKKKEMSGAKWGLLQFLTVLSTYY